MSSRRVGVPLAAALLISAGIAGGQSTRPNPSDEAAAKLRQHLTPERLAASRSLLAHLGHALSVPSVGYSRNGSIVELQLENWKRSLSVDTLAPIARQGLAILLREDSSAGPPAILRARFSDYAPRVVTLTWSATDFKAHPERFRVTRSK